MAIALFMIMTMASAMQAFDIGQTVVKASIGDRSMAEAAAYLQKQAKAFNIPQIGHSPLYKEYQALGLKDFRHAEIFQFCDIKAAQALIEYDIHFAAHLPCRVALIEDEHGKGWFVMVNPAILGSSLPAELQQKVGKVCGTLLKIIGAKMPLDSTNIPKMSVAQTVIKVQIDEDLLIDDVIDSLKLRANSLNVKAVGHHVIPLDNKRVEIFQFCDARIAHKILQRNLSAVAYMPCRIVVIEDEKGQNWLMMMNMDLFIQAAKIAPDLQSMAFEFRDKMMKIIEAAAVGDL
jgi:uncharacterized protein (DUF302 family)